MQNVRKAHREARNVLLRSSLTNNPKGAGPGPDLGHEKALSDQESHIILVIGGPTASGKNELALQLAKRFAGEIINADSRQLYRDLQIGTGQPTEKEKQTVPHHLYGILPIHQAFTAADYQEQATRVILEIQKRCNLPIVAGGTGFYIKALLKGVWSVPPRDSDLRNRFRLIEKKRGRVFLHKLLTRVDPASANSIAMNDTYRIIRALEIYFQSGKKRSDFVHETNDRWMALKFFLNPKREELRNRIRIRTEKMFSDGWVEEVRRLSETHPDFDSTPAAASLGYRRILCHLRGELSLEECKESIIRETIQYAKRQTTWFRNQDSFIGVAGEAELYKISDVLQLRGGSPKGSSK